MCVFFGPGAGLADAAGPVARRSREGKRLKGPPRQTRGGEGAGGSGGRGTGEKEEEMWVENRKACHIAVQALGKELRSFCLQHCLPRN